MNDSPIAEQQAADALARQRMAEANAAAAAAEAAEALLDAAQG